MFGAHLPELLIVLVLALVVFGPKRLPEIGGALGKSIREFREGTSDLQNKAADADHDAHPGPSQISNHEVPASPMPNDVAATGSTPNRDARS